MSAHQTVSFEQFCHGCGKAMFGKAPLGERGFIGSESDSYVELQSDGIDLFYVCPHCNAKNVVDVESIEGEGARIKITRLEK